MLLVYKRYAYGRITVLVGNTDRTAEGTNTVYVYRCKLLTGQPEGFSVVINPSQEEILFRTVWRKAIYSKIYHKARVRQLKNVGVGAGVTVGWI